MKHVDKVLLKHFLKIFTQLCHVVIYRIADWKNNNNNKQWASTYKVSLHNIFISFLKGFKRVFPYTSRFLGILVYSPWNTLYSLTVFLTFIERKTGKKLLGFLNILTYSAVFNFIGLTYTCGAFKQLSNIF